MDTRCYTLLFFLCAFSLVYLTTMEWAHERLYVDAFSFLTNSIVHGAYMLFILRR